MNLNKGSNVPLGDVSMVTVGVSWSGRDTVLVNDMMVAAVLCGSDGRALSGADVVFANQMADSALSVSMDDDLEQIDIDLTKVPENVDKIDIVLWINSAKRNLSLLDAISARVLVTQTGIPIAETGNTVANLDHENATCLLSVYRYKGAWKVRHVAQGWTNGLDGLLSAYGVK